MGFEDSLDGVEVVVGCDKGVGGEFGVYAGGVGDAGGGESRAGADEEGIVVSVVSAVEL